MISFAEERLFFFFFFLAFSFLQLLESFFFFLSFLSASLALPEIGVQAKY